MNSENPITELIDNFSPILDLNKKLQQSQLLTKVLNGITFHNIKILNLCDNSINNFPKDFFDAFPNLSTLDLRQNRLSSLNRDIAQLRNLRILRLCHNSLASLPFCIGDLSILEVLTVSHNLLTSLPFSIGSLSNLSTLNISENIIKVLPEEISNLRNLKILNLYHNQFISLPVGLWKQVLLEEFSLEWFTYCKPKLPCLIKGSEGEIIISNFRALCKGLWDAKVKELSMIAFIIHFSEDNECENLAFQKHSFHIAAANNDLSVLEGILLFEPKVLNLVNSDSCSALTISLLKNHTNAAKILLRKGADILRCPSEYGSILHLAVNTLDIDIVKEIINNKGNIFINKHDSKGNTPLHILFQSFVCKPLVRESITKILLAAGCNPNARNNENWTTAHIAARQDNSESVEILARINKELEEKGSELFNFNAKGGNDNWTPLHIASFTGCFDTVKILIENKANVLAKCSEGKIPRFYARSHLSIFKILMRAERSIISQHFCENPSENYETPKSVMKYENPYILPKKQDKISSKNQAFFGKKIKIQIQAASSFIEPKTTRSVPKTAHFCGISRNSSMNNKSVDFSHENIFTRSVCIQNIPKERKNYEKYNDWMRKIRKNVNLQYEIMENIKDFKGDENKNCLKIDIVRIAGNFPTIKLMQTLLLFYKEKITNLALKYEVCNAVNNISLEFERKRELVSISNNRSYNGPIVNSFE